MSCLRLLFIEFEISLRLTYRYVYVKHSELLNQFSEIFR